MIQITLGAFRDVGRVANFEAATQEFPFDYDEVKRRSLAPGQESYIASVGKKMVGYTLVSFNKQSDALLIDSIGVAFPFRRVGVGRKLVDHVAAAARADALSKIRILVPSYLIEDKDDPWNIEHWLWRLEFKATTTQDDACHRYGRDYDLYVFDRSVR